MDVRRTAEGLLKRCGRKTAAAGALLLALSSASLYHQHTLQAELLRKLSEPGAIAASVLISIEPVAEGLFTRRDRATVTIGTSVLSDNPSAKPLTLEFEVAAVFAPWGLRGELIPLNTTETSARLLGNLRGELPRAEFTYALSLFSREFTVETLLTPFEFEAETTDPEMGPLRWRVLSDAEIRGNLTTKVDHPVRLGVEADDLTVAVFDAAANQALLDMTDGRFAGVCLPRSASRLEREWFLSEAEASAGTARLQLEDPRGRLEIDFTDLVQTLSQSAQAARIGDDRHGNEADPPPEALDGDFALTARDASVRLLPRFAPEPQTFDAESVALRTRALNVPTSLFETMDEEEIGRDLRRAGTVSFHLDEFSFLTEGRRTFAQGFLTGDMNPAPNPEIEAAAHAERGSIEFTDQTVTKDERQARRTKRFRTAATEEPNLAWNLEVEMPPVVLRTVSTLLSGKRRGLGEALAANVEPKDTPEGELSTLSFRGDLRHGAKLNGRDFPWAVTRRYEATEEGFRKDLR